MPTPSSSNSAPTGRRPVGGAIFAFLAGWGFWLTCGIIALAFADIDPFLTPLMIGGMLVVTAIPGIPTGIFACLSYLMAAEQRAIDAGTQREAKDASARTTNGNDPNRQSPTPSPQPPSSATLPPVRSDDAHG